MLSLHARQGKAEIQELLYLFTGYAAIEENRKPMSFIHVIGSKIARFGDKRGHQIRIQLHIQDIRHFPGGQAQKLPGNMHDKTVPLPRPLVPQHRRIKIIAKRLIRLRPKILSYILQDTFPCCHFLHITSPQSCLYCII